MQGVAFLEYSDPNTTDVAIAGLAGLEVCGRALLCERATKGKNFEEQRRAQQLMATSLMAGMPMMGMPPAAPAGPAAQSPSAAAPRARRAAGSLAASDPRNKEVDVIISRAERVIQAYEQYSILSKSYSPEWLQATLSYRLDQVSFHM